MGTSTVEVNKDPLLAVPGQGESARLTVYRVKHLTERGSVQVDTVSSASLAPSDATALDDMPESPFPGWNARGSIRKGIVFTEDGEVGRTRFRTARSWSCSAEAGCSTMLAALAFRQHPICQ